MNINNYVIAVYYRECYAGEETLRLEKVFVCGEDIPEKYNTYKYIWKCMMLCETN